LKYQIPQNIRELVPYEPVTADYDVRLDANESFLNLPEPIVSEFQEALPKVLWNRYPDASAQELCKAFADYYQVDTESVVAFDGSDEVLALLNATLFQGGKAAAFAEDFSMYRQYALTYGVDCVTLHKEADLTISVDRVLRQIEEEGISILLFSNPCNPTSIGLCRSEVLRLVQNTDALVVLDEAYMDFWRKEESLLDVVDEYENLIILKTCSKALGMASIRIGFAVSKVFSKTFKAVKSPYNVNTVSQLLGTILFSHPEYLQDAAEKLIASRAYLQEEVSKLQMRFPSVLEELYPSVTNFLYLKTKACDTIYRAALSNSISIRKMNGYLRITAGSEEENRRLLSFLSNILPTIEGTV